ncbi:MAG: polysaccharide pyruvyl transferase family protein, partial [Vicinamibacteraceae bacterium]
PTTARASAQAAWRASLQRTIATVLDPVITQFSECALVDFPAYPNVGDNAIWLGTVDYLQSRGVRIKYVCDIRHYSAAELRRAVRKGAILIEGGGNLGDLWKHHQRFRERVLTDFPDKTIVQLPQSIHFTSAETLDRAQSVINEHPSFLLFVRDQTSLAFAKKYFSCEARLCPDLAFMMREERLATLPPQSGTIVYLCRSDKESIADKVGQSLLVPGLIVVDWIQTQPSMAKAAFQRTWRWRRRPIRMLQRLPFFLSRKQQRRLEAANGMAQERVDYGAQLLGRGAVVVTDRLHAHILATCLGRPNVLFDNSYGKVTAFVREWTENVPGVWVCGSEEEAIALAQQVASTSKG